MCSCAMYTKLRHQLAGATSITTTLLGSLTFLCSLSKGTRMHMGRYGQLLRELMALARKAGGAPR